MANKVFRKVQDELNRFTTSQLERYGQELSGKLALVIFDKQYAIVETTFQPGVITFTNQDYKINKKSFEERDRRVGDKSIMFDVRHKASPYHYEAWERIDLAFVGDFIMYEDQYARITDISATSDGSGAFVIKTTETDEEITFGVSKAERELLEDLYERISDFLTALNPAPLRELETPEEPQPEKTPKESGKHLVEFNDGYSDYIDRSDFCVIGDKVNTSYGEGKITNFDVEQNQVFLQKDNGINFHCYANEVVELIGDEQPNPEPDEEEQDDNKICKSVTIYEELAESPFSYFNYSYISMLFFGIADSAPELFNYYLELKKNCNWVGGKGEAGYYFKESDYKKWMTDLDEKLFKFMLLKIKNDPSYFEGKGYERYYYDKLHNLFSTISSTNKVLTGETNDSQYMLYAIGENLFNFYVMFDNKDQNIKFEVIGDRIIEKNRNEFSNIIRYQETLFHLLKNDYVLKDASETSIYKKMEIFINLVQQ